MVATMVATSPPKGLSLETLAERQDGVVSLQQAVRSGVSQRQVRRRRAAGRYKRSRRGVVAIAGVPPSWRQRVRIAAIAAGQTVVVSHASAVRVHGVEMPQPVHRRWRKDGLFIEVSAPLLRHVRLRGVRGHRTGTWEEADDIVDIDGMRVTSPLRTVIDLSSRLGVEGTGRLVDSMLRKKALSMRTLRERVERLRPAPGRSVRVLRAVVAGRPDDFDPGESTLESRIRMVIQKRKFPSPTGQFEVRDGSFSVRLDLSYPEVKVYLEGDGFGFHRYASDLDRDSRKHNGLAARGWLGLHFTWRMTDDEIADVLDRFYDRATGTWTLPR